MSSVKENEKRFILYIEVLLIYSNLWSHKVHTSVKLSARCLTQIFNVAGPIQTYYKHYSINTTYQLCKGIV